MCSACTRWRVTESLIKPFLLHSDAITFSTWIPFTRRDLCKTVKNAKAIQTNTYAVCSIWEHWTGHSKKNYTSFLPLNISPLNRSRYVQATTKCHDDLKVQNGNLTNCKYFKECKLHSSFHYFVNGIALLLAVSVCFRFPLFFHGRLLKEFHKFLPSIPHGLINFIGYKINCSFFLAFCSRFLLSTSRRLRSKFVCNHVPIRLLTLLFDYSLCDAAFSTSRQFIDTSFPISFRQRCNSAPNDIYANNECFHCSSIRLRNRIYILLSIKIKLCKRKIHLLLNHRDCLDTMSLILLRAV